MANNFLLANAAANAAADAVCALLNSGTIKVYTGTQPATADTALSGNTLLGTLTFGVTAFGGSAAGVATANAITQDASADNTGTATWFRCLTSGSAKTFDGSVGTSSADMIMASVSITAGQAITCTSMTYTQPKS